MHVSTQTTVTLTTVWAKQRPASIRKTMAPLRLCYKGHYKCIIIIIIIITFKINNMKIKFWSKRVHRPIIV